MNTGQSNLSFVLNILV